ncbi:MAG: ATP-binding cassette domain-containing protein [Rhodospirillales bacterium]
MNEILFEFENIAGGYGGSTVVRGVSGRLAAGEVLGITGRNGVGKSTLLKLLFGFLALQSGSVRFAGNRIDGLSPSERNRSGISFCPQERIVFDDLSVWENLSLMHRDRKAEDLSGYFDHFPRLAERIQQRAGTLSGGERKMLSFVRTMGEEQPLILMDEPTEGVQQENIDHMAQLMAEAKSAGRACMVVEQNLNFIHEVADYLIVLDQGRSVLEGPRGELSNDQIISHLGV